MVFHVRWIFHHKRLGGIRRLVMRKIHLTSKTIQNAYIQEWYQFINGMKIEILHEYNLFLPHNQWAPEAQQSYDKDSVLFSR